MRISECGRAVALLGALMCFFAACVVALYSVCVFHFGNEVCGRLYWIPVLSVVLPVLIGLLYLCLQSSVLLYDYFGVIYQEYVFYLLLILIGFVSADFFIEDPPPRSALLWI